MTTSTNESASEVHVATGACLYEHSAPKTIIQAGAIGGMAGGVVIWIYEAVVWVGAQHLIPLAGIPPNATGLVFGLKFQHAIGVWAYFLGTGIHFTFAIGWGILFAAIWPYFRRRGFEATLVALLYAPVAWIVMHAAINDRHERPSQLLRSGCHHWRIHVPHLLQRCRWPWSSSAYLPRS